jgi:hypothetical protein
VIVPRPAWGALAPVGDLPPLPASLSFLTVHGVGESPSEHAGCAAWMAAAQLVAIDGGGQDIPWTAVICPHGEIYEGRGVMAAPGHDVGHGAVEAQNSLSLMIRSNDLGGMTPQQLWVFRWYVHGYIDSLFAGLTIASHRDWDPEVSCPGGGIAAAVGELNSERAIGGTVP